MKSTGIVRKVDQLGRVVIPIELRRTLEIADQDSLEFYVEGNQIVLQKYEPAINAPKTLIRELLDTERPTNVFAPSADLVQRMREAVY